MLRNGDLDNKYTLNDLLILVHLDVANSLQMEPLRHSWVVDEELKDFQKYINRNLLSEKTKATLHSFQ